MVDFSKFRANTPQPNITDPLEIYRRLPKPKGINDLYTSQAEVLSSWYQRRGEKDVVIKLHTGGGKTLVGLLVAQSMLKESKSPIVYLAATRQLVEQTHQKAKEYSISTVTYLGESHLPDDFLSAQKPLICTYQALFNGKSRFGTSVSGKAPIKLGGIILDDAHVSFSTVRDSFSLSIRKDEDPEGYAYISSIFRSEFQALDQLGTFDDVILSQSTMLLEVPYWSWIPHLLEIQQFLTQYANDKYKFAWPLLRDSLKYAHCIIGASAVTITPIFPFVEMFPSFANCPHRVFMSATTGDDSGIIQTFDIAIDAALTPIVSDSLAGVSERMILIPELMPFDQTDIKALLEKIINYSVMEHNAGVVILCPSRAKAQAWASVAKIAQTTDMVGEYVAQLQNGASKGPFAFVNRYDGIDLPGESCRLLVMSGLPSGIDDFDTYQTIVFQESDVIDGAIARRIEQGIGRAARGAGDYCVVILIGQDLASWLSRSNNHQLLTTSTRAQIEIGQVVSKAINEERDLLDVISQCLSRDNEWIRYHAETLADLTSQENRNILNLEVTEVQRKAFDLLRKGNGEKAVQRVQNFLVDKGTYLRAPTKGWLYQFGAQIAFIANLVDEASDMQKQAFGLNRSLSRPPRHRHYDRQIAPGEQARGIISKIQEYRIRRGFITEFDNQCAYLTSTSTANQFERALVELGKYLGFEAERPENDFGVGPDVLWLLDKQQAWVIEAKSKKNPQNFFTKEEHGQLLASADWFKSTYSDYKAVPVSVHPNTLATKHVSVDHVRVLTLTTLTRLISELRSMLIKLCDLSVSEEELVLTCEKMLIRSNLNASNITLQYLETFEVISGNTERSNKPK